MSDVETLSREALVALVRQQQALIAELQATVAQLQARVHELEARLGTGGPRGMPGHKPTQAQASEPKPRKRREHGFARLRATPTERVVHAQAACPDCGCPLVGGSIKRTREVIEIEPTPVKVVEHVVLERTCPLCRRRWTPTVDLGGVVLGQQRLGIGLVSLIATLREAGRLPFETIQWYLETVHGLHLSVGGVVAALRQVRRRAEAEVERIRAHIRASPVVHADETGWRQGGRNGSVWTFSTPTARWFVYGGRTKAMVDEALGDEFAGVLVSDCSAAYHHYEGVKQRCWAHLLRELHELRAGPPDDQGLASWATAVHALFLEAKAFASPAEAERLAAQAAFEQRLLALCQPFVADEAAPQRKLCARISRHLSELFVFVASPAVPPDNNAAERSLRHLVTSRKISGGTRSEQGTETKLALASLFGTWRAQGHNPLLACRQLLASPQV